MFRDPDDHSQILVKGGDTFVTISILSGENSVNYRINRTYPRGGSEDQALAELWETGRAVTRMVRDLAFADNYYNATQEQLDQLSGLTIRLPHLNGAQQKKITDLYKATGGKTGDDLAKADQAACPGCLADAHSVQENSRRCAIPANAERAGNPAAGPA